MNDQQILQAITQKAWKDSVFKQNLIEQPVSTIENFVGYAINLPEGKKISVVDQSDASTIFINLPAEPNSEDMELNEEQLNIVSGGDADPPVIVKPVNYNGSLFGGS